MLPLLILYLPPINSIQSTLSELNSFGQGFVLVEKIQMLTSVCSIAIFMYPSRQASMPAGQSDESTTHEGEMQDLITFRNR